ncbi:O-methyltransferase, family 3 [Penicillium griseofulvum]|uniref:O-methyltransferase, family 3 n=1 Tax=Penicillium patulum TaxID=5078 RepID=A0A135LEB4_PENPA|nr:O-methyltransferase, family 3 [Penicillium griseofulvum]KXG47299.1 O-methyltransferase, family 3 [Penicillium griseofulvum]
MDQISRWGAITLFTTFLFMLPGLHRLLSSYNHPNSLDIPVLGIMSHWSNNSWNPRWEAVDTYAISHGHPDTRPNAQTLQDTISASNRAGLPSHALSAAQAKFLSLHCRTANVTHALEIGTLGGYSAIWMASQNPQLHLTTIEYDEHHYKTAKRNIDRSKLSDRIEVINGAALDVLGRLREEVDSGRRPPFGFTFIDADKVNNWKYFLMAKDMSKPNSVICVDNIVRDGHLVSFNDNDSYLRGCREVVEKAGKEPGVDSVVLQTVGEKGYDGWLWAVIN